MHGGLVGGPDNSRPAKSTRIIDYSGSVQQALRDLSEWVENGKAPPASTAFELVDGQVRVPTSAAERKGIQPVVSLTVNGAVRADVVAGETVDFTGVAELAPGTGTIVSAEWDFEGVGDYPLKTSGIDGSLPRLVLKTSYAFKEPGTYFPALRVTSQRQGNLATPYGRVQNLGRSVSASDRPNGSPIHDRGGAFRPDAVRAADRREKDRYADHRGTSWRHLVAEGRSATLTNPSPAPRPEPSSPPSGRPPSRSSRASSTRLL